MGMATNNDQGRVLQERSDKRSDSTGNTHSLLYVFCLFKSIEDHIPAHREHKY